MASSGEVSQDAGSSNIRSEAGPTHLGVKRLTMWIGHSGYLKSSVCASCKRCESASQVQ